MKKFLTLILSAMLMLTASASAQEVMGGSETHNIYVEGKVKTDVSAVTLKMTDKEKNIAYIAEVPVSSDNTYKYKFKFGKDFENYTMSINNGGEDITDSIIKTVSETFGLVGSISVSDFAENKASVSAKIINKLDDEGNCTLYFASYDESGKLLDVAQHSLNYDYQNGTEDIIKDVAEGAYLVKIFMWKSAENCIPLANSKKILPEKDVILIGDSLGQAYPSDYVRKGWGEYIGNYMAHGALVNNQCYAGWSTNTYIADKTNGWDYLKQFIGEGDIVIFGIGNNDTGIMGYNGKYYDVVDGKRKLYSTGTKRDVYKDFQFEPQEDDNGEYINCSLGKLYLAKGINLETSKDGMMTYLYKDANGKVQSYAADCFMDNMREMLDYCKEVGAEVVVRNIASICSANPQSMSSNYDGYVTHVIINEQIPKLAEEYENVTTVDLFSETKAHYEKVYNETPDRVDYFYDENGELLPYVNKNQKWQYLADKYWITVKSCSDFYKNGTIGQKDGKWGYYTPTGGFVAQDTLHYNAAGADYIASATAKIIKNSDSPAREYFN